MSVLIASIASGRVAAAGLRRKGAGRSAGARFTLDTGDEAQAETPAGAAFVCPTALLQIQEAPEREPPGAHTALRHGDDLLDRLDDLRLALLAGAIPASRLRALSDALAARREASGNPHLDQIIAEIELRAAVELAKLNRGAAG